MLCIVYKHACMVLSHVLCSSNNNVYRQLMTFLCLKTPSCVWLWPVHVLCLCSNSAYMWHALAALHIIKLFNPVSIYYITLNNACSFRALNIFSVLKYVISRKILFITFKLHFFMHVSYMCAPVTCPYISKPAALTSFEGGEEILWRGEQKEQAALSSSSLCCSACASMWLCVGCSPSLKPSNNAHGISSLFNHGFNVCGRTGVNCWLLSRWQAKQNGGNSL